MITCIILQAPGSKRMNEKKTLDDLEVVVAPKTIQDIDVEHAHDVDTSIVINTCKKVKGKFINKPTSTGCFVRATPFSFEL